MKRCLAPCAGKVSQEEYGKMITQVMLLMDGKISQLEKDLKEKMQQASDTMAYEQAARYRDALLSLDTLHEKQNATTETGDKDVIGLAMDDTGVCVQVFFVRSGKILGRDSYFLDQEKGSPAEDIMEEFLKEYYGDQRFAPKEILLNIELSSDVQTLLINWLMTKNEKKVTLEFPQRGLKHDLVKMVETNADKFLKERLRKGRLATESNLDAAEDLQKAIGLTKPLARMDCFDISHTQGKETVASMVVFRDGAISKKDYRRYKIKSAEGKPDDFKSMQEVVYRRYKDAEDLPNLVIIDGGKGQLSSALEVIRGLGLAELPVIGLAKREEEIFREGEHTPIVLDKTSPALHLIQRIRDEAHRFAITYHRKLRGKRNLVSILDHLEGVGPKRREALWKRFGSLDAMRAATVEDIAAIQEIPKTIAQELFTFFHSDVMTKQEQLKK
jgi:excinuclease ABC subunit C